MKGRLKENYFSADGALYKDDQVTIHTIDQISKKFRVESKDGKYDNLNCNNDCKPFVKGSNMQSKSKSPLRCSFEDCLCDTDTNTCLNSCSKGDICYYVSKDGILENPDKTKCVASDGRYICPLGSTSCKENSKNIKRLCDPYNPGCDKVNTKSKFDCWIDHNQNKRSPWIGFNNNTQDKKVSTTNKETKWCINN